MEKVDYRTEITTALIKQMEEGTAPWVKPWEPGQRTRSPFNASTDRAYSGFNAIWLAARGFDDPRWMTYKQAAAQGLQVKAGSKATTIEYWKWHEDRPLLDQNGNPVLDERGKPQKQAVRLTSPKVFYAKLFNAAQIEGMEPLPVMEPRFETVPELDSYLAETGIPFHEDQHDRAYYSPSDDEIHLPPKDSFKGQYEYYATLIHEMGHATGHANRLARDLSGGFGTENYAREELRAEMASYMVTTELGLGHYPDRHARYLEGWLKAAKEDKHFLFRVAREADVIRSWLLEPEKRQQLEQQHQRRAEQAAQRTQTRGATMEQEQSPPERVYLNVPYEEREEVKKFGGRWDQDRQLWHVPADQLETAQAAGNWSLAGEQGQEQTQQQEQIPPVIYESARFYAREGAMIKAYEKALETQNGFNIAAVPKEERIALVRVEARDEGIQIELERFTEGLLNPSRIEKENTIVDFERNGSKTSRIIFDDGIPPRLESLYLGIGQDQVTLNDLRTQGKNTILEGEITFLAGEAPTHEPFSIIFDGPSAEQNRFYANSVRTDFLEYIVGAEKFISRPELFETMVIAKSSGDIFRSWKLKGSSLTFRLSLSNDADSRDGPQASLEEMRSALEKINIRDLLNSGQDTMPEVSKVDSYDPESIQNTGRFGGEFRLDDNRIAKFTFSTEHKFNFELRGALAGGARYSFEQIHRNVTPQKEQFPSVHDTARVGVHKEDGALFEQFGGRWNEDRARWDIPYNQLEAILDFEKKAQEQDLIQAFREDRNNPYPDLDVGEYNRAQAATPPFQLKPERVMWQPSEYHDLSVFRLSNNVQMNITASSKADGDFLRDLSQSLSFQNDGPAPDVPEKFNLDTELKYGSDGTASITGTLNEKPFEISFTSDAPILAKGHATEFRSGLLEYAVPPEIAIDVEFSSHPDDGTQIGESTFEKNWSGKRDSLYVEMAADIPAENTEQRLKVLEALESIRIEDLISAKRENLPAGTVIQKAPHGEYLEGGFKIDGTEVPLKIYSFHSKNQHLPTAMLEKIASNFAQEHVKEQAQTQEQRFSVPAKESRAYLAVPYDDKDEAKAMGANWDRDKKLWFVHKDNEAAIARFAPANEQEAKATRNPQEEFADFLKSYGVALKGVPVMDGNFHRVSLEDDSKGKQSASYRAFTDGVPAGTLKLFKGDQTIKWIATGHTLTPEEKAALDAQAANRKIERQQETKEEQERAGKQAYAIWKNAPNWANAHNSDYLAQKQVEGRLGLKVNDKGHTLVPLRDASGFLRNVQTISPEGKRFLKNGKKDGLFHSIGFVDHPNPDKDKIQTIVIAEGVATASTLHNATNLPTVVAFDSGNLKPVAENIRKEYPNANLVFAADNDHHLLKKEPHKNVGLEKAKEAAQAVGGTVLEPRLTPSEKAQGLTDFNDIQIARGKDKAFATIKAQVNELIAPQKEMELTPQKAPEQEKTVGQQRLEYLKSHPKVIVVGM